MSDDYEPLNVEIETSDAEALVVSMLLEENAKALQKVEGSEHKRYSLSLEISEVEQ